MTQVVLARRAAAALLGAFCIGAAACERPVERDLEAILERDTLVVLTTFNSTSYFLYRGEPLGYEFELLRSFADEHDVALRMVPIRDRDELIPMLRRGEGDLIAARLVPTDEKRPQVAFTARLYETQPVLVQATRPPDEAGLPDPVDTIVAAPDDAVTIRARVIAEKGQLGGETVHVIDRRPYTARLLEISDSITGDIHIVELEGDVTHEQLVRDVARGGTGLAMTQENLALLSAEYFENVTVRPVLGPPHGVSWAVRPNAPRLLEALNEWIERERDGERFAQLYEKYFVDRAGYRERVASEYLTSETGRLSAYDDLLREAARELGWDWLLLASQMYQESEFNPRARSWAGAMGLMQLMPRTAEMLGVADPWDPEQNVRGSIAFTRDLRERWTELIPDPDERLRFILASYNVGPGHVDDARRLAEKNGDDPDVWDDVAFWLLQKSQREVYTDPVVRHGFARGLEPVTYVELILFRWEHYRQFVVD